MAEQHSVQGDSGREPETDLLVPYRLKAAGVGAQVTVLLLASLAVYLLLPGHTDIPLRFFLPLIAVAAAPVTIMPVVSWRSLLGGPHGLRYFYAWSSAAIVLITLGISVTGGLQSELFFLYALALVFAATSYPPRQQAFFLGLTVASYIVVLALAGWGITPATLFLRVSSLSLLVLITSFLSRALAQELAGHHAARAESERRARRLATVAAAARSMSTLDPDRVLATVVDAVVDLGFEAANMCIYSEDGASYHVAHPRGLPDSYAGGVHPTNIGMPAVVLRRGDTVVMEDYAAHPDAVPVLRESGYYAVIASPVWSQGRLAAALVGGTRQRRELMADEVEAFELLAAQAGRALENAAFTDELRRHEARFRSLVQHSSDVITLIDADGIVAYQSPGIEQVFGHKVETIEGASSAHVLSDLIHPDDVARILAAFEELASRPGHSITMECRSRHADGTWRYIASVGTNLMADPNVRGIVVNSRDVTAQRTLEEELRRQAFHDPLTGLANRALFRDRVEHALARAKRRGTQVSLLFLDLDGFKTVNDSLGHPTGDQLLVLVGRRLEAALRPSDTIARLGGDEFAVLLEEVAEDEALEAAERLLTVLQEPFDLQGQEVFISASIGIAAAGAGEERADDLIRNADTAMYTAKSRGKAHPEVFVPGMHAHLLERLQLRADLSRAVEHGELVVHYQPSIRLATGMVAGVEALVRWRHPERGLLYPDDFMPLAEDTGLIVPIGRWVLAQACRQARACQACCPAHPPLTMSVNLSARQLEHPALVQDVANVLEESGLDPAHLILEITESVLVHDTELASERLRELKALGVQLAIDDFGTGYSSLAYLRNFPVDIVKVDKSFVAALNERTDTSRLAQAILELGRTLRLQTVAEGVEQEGQFAQLRDLRCDFGQGYYFARPLEEEQVQGFLRETCAGGLARPGRYGTEEPAA